MKRIGMKIMSIMLMTVMLFGLVPMSVMAAPETYPVWVGSTQVTSANKDDILGDGGKAKFDPDTNTLTLNNPSVSGEYNYASVYAQGIDLTMEGSATLSGSDAGIFVSSGSLSLNGDFTISGVSSGVFVKYNITITGGTVTASGDISGIEMNSNESTLTVTGGELKVSGKNGIRGYNGGSNLKVEGGTVAINSTEKAINVLTVTFSGGTVTATGGGNGISSGDITVTGGKVTASGSEHYGISCKNLTINGGEVEAYGDSTAHAIYASSAITLGEGIAVVTPSGGSVSEDKTCIVDSENEKVVHAVIRTFTPTTHIVTFDTAGGSTVPPQTVNNGEKAVRPADPVREGFGFGDWYSDDTRTTLYDFDAPVTGDITLYASWKSYIAAIEVVKVWDDDDNAAGKRPDHVDVKIFADGTEKTVLSLNAAGEWKAISVMSSGKPDVELTCEEIVPEGYTLVSSVKEGNTVILTNKYGVTPAPVHTVKFESDGGSAVLDQTVADGEKAVKPADPTKEGFEFGGWYKDSWLTEPYDFNTPVTGDITLYAKWINYLYVVEVVKVWDDNDDAAGKRPDSIDVKILADGIERSAITLNKDQEWKTFFLYPSGKPDVEFACEEIVPEGYNLVSNVKEGNTITLTNQYIAAPPTPQAPAPVVCTVKFDANGGSGNMPDITVGGGKQLTLPENGFTAPQDKVFDRWDAGKPGDIITVTGNLTIKAVWKNTQDYHEHVFIWQVTRKATPEDDGEMIYTCKECGAVAQVLPISGYAAFNEDAADKIRNAQPGAEVVISTKRWISLGAIAWNELTKRPDVKLVIDYQDNDRMYEVVIPAGTDIKALMNEEGYAGFLFLSGRFGRNEIQVY